LGRYYTAFRLQLLLFLDLLSLVKTSYQWYAFDCADFHSQTYRDLYLDDTNVYLMRLGYHNVRGREGGGESKPCNVKTKNETDKA